MTHVVVQLWSGALVPALDHAPDADELDRIAAGIRCRQRRRPPKVRTIGAFVRRAAYEVP